MRGSASSADQALAPKSRGGGDERRGGSRVLAALKRASTATLTERGKPVLLPKFASLIDVLFLKLRSDVSSFFSSRLVSPPSIAAVKRSSAVSGTSSPGKFVMTGKCFQARI